MGRWGGGLFQSDWEFDMLGDIEMVVGIFDFQQGVRFNADLESDVNDTDTEGYRFSLYRPNCSHPELVREYVDDVIDDEARNMEESILSDKRPKLFSVYEYLMLGICAMTLGCRLPNSYLALMKELYTEGEYFPEGMQQFRKALFGPNGFKNGEPYDFESKDLLATVNGIDEDEEEAAMELSGPVAPLGVLQKSIEDPWRYHVINEMREMRLNPDDCGGCGAKGPKAWKSVLFCRCQERMYCSKRCKQAHWKVHKKVCDRIGRI